MASTEASDKAFGLQPPSCEVCHTQKGPLLRCRGCDGVRYCGKDHQVAGWGRHKRACKIVKEARIAYEREAEAWQAKQSKTPLDPPSQGGSSTPDSTPDTVAVSRFKFASALIACLAPITDLAPRAEPIQMALDHFLGALRLSREFDHLCDYVPQMYLRLGQDQACYRFLTWYAMDEASGSRPKAAPFWDAVAPADMLEAPQGPWASRSFVSLAFTLSLLLIKVRLLLDLQTMQRAVRGLGGTLPLEIVDAIGQELLIGDVLGRAWPGLPLGTVAETSGRIARLQTQVRQLYEEVDEHNVFFWRAMLYAPEFSLLDEPCMAGSKDEAEAIGLQYFAAWSESGPALGVVTSLCKKAELECDGLHALMDWEDSIPRLI